MADSPKIPLQNKPGVVNWTEKYNALGGKTNWIRRTAEHLQGKGMPEGIAIATAVNAAQKMCETGDTNFPGAQQVNAGSRAEACAAYAQWTKAKRQAEAARASNLTASDVYDALHVIDLARSFLRYEARERQSLPGGAAAAYLELSEPVADVIDLTFDEVKHPRIPHGHGGGEFAKLAGRVERLKVAVGSVKVPVDGKRFKRIERVATSGDRQFRVVHAAHVTHHATAHEAVAKALAQPQSSALLPKRINSPAMVLANGEQAAVDLAGGKQVDNSPPAMRIVKALRHPDPKVRARARFALRLIAMRKGVG